MDIQVVESDTNAYRYRQMLARYLARLEEKTAAIHKRAQLEDKTTMNDDHHNHHISRTRSIENKITIVRRQLHKDLNRATRRRLRLRLNRLYRQLEDLP